MEIFVRNVCDMFSIIYDLCLGFFFGNAIIMRKRNRVACTREFVTVG